MNLLETENLFETRGKLSAVPEEFYAHLDSLKNMDGLTSESEIFVDPLKSTDDNHRIHNWTYVVNHYVNDPEVAFVLLRSNRVVLMLASKNPIITKRSTSYVAMWSNIAMTIPAIRDQFYDMSDDNIKIVNSEDPLKKFMSKTINGYITYKQEKEQQLHPDQPPRTKKNWDIVVVKIDPKHHELEVKRKEEKAGAEVKPPKKYNNNTDISLLNDKEREQAAKYNDYINELKKEFKERLKMYKINHMPVINNARELKSLAKSMNQTIPTRIKIIEIPYKYNSIEPIVKNGNITLRVIYNIDNPSAEIVFGEEYYDKAKSEGKFDSLNYCMCEIKTEGLKSTYDLKSFAFNRNKVNTYGYSSSDSMKFSDGISLIKKLIKKINELKEQNNSN